MKIPQNYLEKTYTGLLGKVIGVRLGAPIEGWTYERIQNVYGEIDGYLVDYNDFAADDDTNGPVFLIRALSDYACGPQITPRQIGLTLLNYAPYEHGFFWWGGYGTSTEHTAYLNLRNGIEAPLSGSVEQNGATVAEQIGGQIFIDTWGLVIPANPQEAAEYAKKAASVTHGGEGIHGGMFIAACISAAFVETNIAAIINAGLSVIPPDCAYSLMVKDVAAYFEGHPEEWRDCFHFVQGNYGYDRYPGSCHIIPNSAVITLALLYGRGDFSRSVNIANMCGWDTDCNVANVGTILGVLNGLEGIDYHQWREPVNDFLACSSVMGSMNIGELAECASFLSHLAYRIAGETPPESWSAILNGNAPKFHFEYPGSTQAIRLKYDKGCGIDCRIANSADYAHGGSRSLRVTAVNVPCGKEIKAYYKTYYRPRDFYDSRYDPAFSPALYPGQSVKGYLFIPPDESFKGFARLYAYDGNTGEYLYSEKQALVCGEWMELRLTIPPLTGACIEEAGVSVIFADHLATPGDMIFYLDDFSFGGSPDYLLDFSKERIEKWTFAHTEISQCTYLKGLWDLENGQLSGSCADFAELYTGDPKWGDYVFEATVIPQLGEAHNINFRVQGAVRSYAAGLSEHRELVLYKNDGHYTVLCRTPLEWKDQETFHFRITVTGSRLSVLCNGVKLEYTDRSSPYLNGAVGASVWRGSHCHYEDFRIRPVM